MINRILKHRVVEDILCGLAHMAVCALMIITMPSSPTPLEEAASKSSSSHEVVSCAAVSVEPDTSKVAGSKSKIVGNESTVDVGI